MTGKRSADSSPQTPDRAHPIVVVMGVSAAGKSAVGSALAQRLGVPFVDADDLHPEANVAKMAAGEPLNDEDRWPWLAEVGHNLALNGDQAGVVIACSALRRKYRDQLRESAPETMFVHLHGDADTLSERASARAGHFMPPALLASQLSTLELLDNDESGVSMDIRASIDELAQAAEAWVHNELNNDALIRAGSGATHND